MTIIEITQILDPEKYNPNILHPNAIILPVIAFPAWILCIAPLTWHFSQRNVAAWSLILWIIVVNFFNSINPLIWPRDNTEEWYNGNVLCDIEVRILVGCSVSLAACTAMIMRRLAKVMDTRNITVASSRNNRIREKVLEALWCWGYPAFMILIYYVVQPVRYYIFAISGCVVAYNLSWVSIVLGAMWGPISVCFAAYYAGLLIYRLWYYRREFHNLVTARNTTKSRFLRLFIMSMIIVVLLLPYSFWILWLFASTLNEQFSWSIVHGPGWNTVIKVAGNGSIRLDKWGQVCCGYLAFIVFGTGTDANNTYKRMLCAIGLGKVFPSLCEMSKRGISTPSSFTFARGLCSTCTSKAKSLFSRNSYVSETIPSPTGNNSVGAETIMIGTTRSGSFPCHPTSTNDPILQQHLPASHSDKSFLARLFARRNKPQPILPLFTNSTVDKMTDTEKSPADTFSSGVHTHAWASNSPTSARHPDNQGDQGVHVVKEVHQDHQQRNHKSDDTPFLV